MFSDLRKNKELHLRKDKEKEFFELSRSY